MQRRALTSLLLALILIPTVPRAAAQGSVQIEGRIDLNLTAESGRGPRMSSASSSYIALTGREPLGGVDAIFALESGFDPDTGSGSRRYWGRESWVGLAHPQARLRLGRSRSPLQLSATAADPQGTDSVGSLGTTALLLGHGDLGRLDDAILVDVTGPAGLSLNAAWALRETSTTQAWHALRLRWRGGGHELAAMQARATGRGHVASLAGAWSLGGLRLTGLWNEGERAGIPRRARLVGLETALAGLHWRLSWSQTERLRPTLVERRLRAIGADLPLSRRTMIYATAAWGRRADASRSRAAELGLQLRF